MNVKVHTPSTLKKGSGMSSLKQFLLSLLATTVSIVLTFGTAAIVDQRKNQAAKKEMVLMIMSDFDKTIESVKKIDNSLRECRRIQQNIATHPEFFDSLQHSLHGHMAWIMDEFPETTEKIFSSNIETFNVIGDVNFVNEVSAFYLARRHYKEMIHDELKELWLGDEDYLETVDSLLDFDFPRYVYLNKSFLEGLRSNRERCMQLMKVSEEQMIAFNKRRIIKADSTKVNTQKEKALEEYLRYEETLDQAREKLKK